jgi:membrane protease YdiL (CAAX protease family)
MLFFTPIQEELVFRVLLFHLLFRRYYSHAGATASTADARSARSGAQKETDKDKMHYLFTCAILSNAFFGLFHLVNLFSSTYSRYYVILQVKLNARSMVV